MLLDSTQLSLLDETVIIFYSDTLAIPLPENHSFPLEKYTLLREKIMAARVVKPDDLKIPQPAGDDDIMRAHDPDYCQRLQQGELT